MNDQRLNIELDIIEYMYVKVTQFDKQTTQIYELQKFFFIPSILVQSSSNRN